MKYRWVLFDMDGTLIDSLNFHAATYQRFLNQMGITLGLDEVKQKIGHTIKITMDNMVPPEKHDQALQQLGRFYLTQVDDLIAEIDVIDGAHDTVRRLKDNGCQVFLVTNSKQEIAKKILQAHSLELFDGVSCADAGAMDKVDRCKQLIQQHGMVPKQTIYIGDSSTDVLAAKKVGIESCLIVNTFSWIHKEGVDPQSIAPTYILDSLDRLFEIL